MSDFSELVLEGVLCQYCGVALEPPWWGVPNSCAQCNSTPPPMPPDASGVYYQVDGRQHIDEEQALSVLLRNEVLFANTRTYLDPFTGEPQEATVVLFVVCNDIFAWACADAEAITTAEIADLYARHAADPRWGAAIWCCLKRNEQPQRPVIAAMKRDGSWEAALAALPPNQYDARRCGSADDV